MRAYPIAFLSALVATDSVSPSLATAGIPTVLFGPGGEAAHAIEEWVSLSDTEAVTRTLVELATRLCA